MVVCLSVPRWIYSVTEKNQACLSQLEPSESRRLISSHVFCVYIRVGYKSRAFPVLSVAETWLCASPDRQTDEMTHREVSDVMCSIQVYTLSLSGTVNVPIKCFYSYLKCCYPFKRCPPGYWWLLTRWFPLYLGLLLLQWNWCHFHFAICQFSCRVKDTLNLQENIFSHLRHNFLLILSILFRPGSHSRTTLSQRTSFLNI